MYFWVNISTSEFHTTRPNSSGCVGIITVTVMVTLMLALHCLLKLLMSLLKLHKFVKEWSIGLYVLHLRRRSTQLGSSKVLLQSTFPFIHATIWHIVTVECPCASCTKCSASFQGSSSWECGPRTTPSPSWGSLAQLGGLLTLYGKGLLHAFKRFKKFMSTLRLGLPCTWAHTKDVTCLVLVAKGPSFLVSLVAWGL